MTTHPYFDVMVCIDCYYVHHYGETFIHDAYFQTYAQQLAEDIGASDSEARWPACHIDWEAAADALRGDYTAYDFDGSTYWARA